MVSKTNTAFAYILFLSLCLSACRGGAQQSIAAQLPPVQLTPEEVTGDSAEASEEPAQTDDLTRSELQFDGEQALEHVAAQVAFGPRPTGSDALRLARAYILDYASSEGWLVEEQQFDWNGTPASNLIAKSGTDGEAFVIIGAHYDTRMVADQDGANPGAPVIGANDGGSGVGVLLELTRTLDTSELDYDVWLVFFDAEDNGRIEGWDWILGSRYFAGQLQDSPEYVIIVDMIGDADQNVYYEQNSDDALSQHLWGIAGELGYADTIIPEDKYSMLDDHTPFLERGIVAVDMIDFDYPYWHTTEDTLDKVSAESLERIGRTLEVFLEAGGQYEGRPEQVEQPIEVEE